MTTTSITHNPISVSGNQRLGILVLHGFTGSPWSMRPVAEYFAHQGYAVEMPLLPGHGTQWEDMLDVTKDDWLAEVDRAYWRLRKADHPVVVIGLSMGGMLAIRQSIRREVVGTVLINPFVTDPTPLLRFAFLLSRSSVTTQGITSDIAKPGVDEGGYLRVPLAATAELHRLGKETRRMLSCLTAPVLYFRSTNDHVVSDESHQFFQKTVHCPVQFIELPRSYHVATLDHDAPMILEKSYEFVQAILNNSEPNQKEQA